MLLGFRVLDLSFLRFRRSIRIPFSQREAGGSLGNVVAEKHSLAPLPGLDTDEEEQSRDDYDCPLPSDGSVFEDDVVDNGDVEGWEDGDEAEDDGPEEEFVAADVVDPSREDSR